MSRLQLALRVPDLAQAVQFYSTLLQASPAKLHANYANFAITQPPLKLVLLQGDPGEATALDHLGVEVESSQEVIEAAERLTAAGLAVTHEEATSCCYAVQDKIWTEGPGSEPWEVYVVKQAADSLTHDNGICCATTAGGVTDKTTLAAVGAADACTSCG
ncbi:ArsI/CadI family heavy metal resistance metalloenzyme [Planobispora longispora]|uniref:Glyoxalase n=1 Tax=Planobispora longispora TaxID=28887 RepID=A0A8J3W6Y3_9ACTN|nr:ArsI/CadI family heavy metal resistance metalloenzyme [Planobispora longispora]BFE79469.1 ArsI/CadI family heavy metal resistance metalloenzyme [Planobispora longispora]GIH78200.1 glyoxalase [Planobispora longispora]